MKKTVGIQYTYLKGKANDIELKSKVKAFYKGAKSGVKTGYKGAKHQFKEIKQQLKTKVNIAVSVFLTLSGLSLKLYFQFLSSHLLSFDLRCRKRGPGVSDVPTFRRGA